MLILLRKKELEKYLGDMCYHSFSTHLTSQSLRILVHSNEGLWQFEVIDPVTEDELPAIHQLAERLIYSVPDERKEKKIFTFLW